jgi:hypothetical protein
MLKKSVNNLGTKLYNRLPKNLKKLEDFKPFKKQLKKLFATTVLLFDRRIPILCVGSMKRKYVYGKGH